MANKHFIIRHRITLEIIHQDCREETTHPAELNAWGDLYELLLVAPTFDMTKHALDEAGDVVDRVKIAPTLSRQSARAGDVVTARGLPANTSLRINGMLLMTDDTGAISWNSRKGDDFIEGCGACRGGEVVPDRDTINRLGTTPRAYRKNDPGVQRFLADRNGEVE